jgi:hypothetical protein
MWPAGSMLEKMTSWVLDVAGPAGVLSGALSA